MNIFSAICGIVEYGIQNHLIDEDDRAYSVNQICEILKISQFEDADIPKELNLENILEAIIDYATENGICENSVVYRDLFDTKIMGALTPKPSTVIKEFNKNYAISPKTATDKYYEFSKKTDYIRDYRIKNDVKWIVDTEYGDIDITINLSKPEKDPKAIAAASKSKNSSYPKCQLCKESEGYCGRVDFPARQNHRIIPISLDGEKFFFQYSPYVYYNEHCIVLNSEHTPMVINKSAFKKLFDFIKQFPHYFVGSNADLPIVGGSILTHEHFQGGNYEFAMAKAPIEKEIKFYGFDDIEAGIVKWPLSVIRLRSENVESLVNLSDKILSKWREYTDEDAFIFSETNGEKHNTITPITRFKNEKFEIDLVLRNNITTEEYPLGVYHPHNEHHHIKKENIGLIEVMGLAVLPSRLKGEMDEVAKAIINNDDISQIDSISKHFEWAETIKEKHPDINSQNAQEIIRHEIGIVFKSILEQCGVFKTDDEGRKHFQKFIDGVNS